MFCELALYLSSLTDNSRFAKLGIKQFIVDSKAKEKKRKKRKKKKKEKRERKVRKTAGAKTTLAYCICSSYIGLSK